MATLSPSLNSTIAATSTTTTKQRSAVEAANYDAKIGIGVQLALPGVGVEAVPLRPRTKKPRPIAGNDAKLLKEFGGRVRRRFSEATARQYAWVLRDFLRLAGTLSGRSVSVAALFTDLDLLGRTLASGKDGLGTRTISAWLASQRRSVVRSFALLMTHELEEIGIGDPSSKVTAALQATAEPVGSGFRLPVGWPRGRGGPMPTDEESVAILHALTEQLGWAAARNAAFLGILSARGQRVGALLKLDGADLHRLRDGRVRMLLHAKSSREPLELVLPVEALAPLDAYAEGFNAWARASGSIVRVGFGQPGVFWRGSGGQPWKYAGWSRELAVACLRAGVPKVTAHGFRRAYATQATSVVPRSVAALAGNWTSPRRMDDHYVQPSLARLRVQLSTLSTARSDAVRVEAPAFVEVT